MEVQVRVTKPDLLFLSQRGFLADPERLWDALLELRKTKRARPSLMVGMAVAGAVLAVLGLLAGVVVGGVQRNFPLQLCCALGLLVGLESAGGLLWFFSAKKTHLVFWAAVAQSGACVVGWPALVSLLQQTWSSVGIVLLQYVALVVTPSVVHLIFAPGSKGLRTCRKREEEEGEEEDLDVELNGEAQQRPLCSTRPVLSVPLFLHSYVVLSLLLVLAFPFPSNPMLGTLPFLGLSILFLIGGITCDSYVRLEPYAPYAHAAGLLGLVATFLSQEVLAVFSWRMSQSWPWQLVVFPLVMIFLIFAGWVVARRQYLLAASSVALLWLTAIGFYVPWALVPSWAIPVAGVAAGAVLVACAVAILRNYSELERFVQQRIPDWMVPQGARRRREYETIL